jgi:SanA protein
MKRLRLKYAAGAVVSTFALMALMNLYIVLSTTHRIYTDIESLPKRKVGLVLGTDLMRPDGSTNLHFLNRVDSAALVYLSGKANSLLISGSTNNQGFNEVLGMQRALLAKGIPARAMLLDFDGNRTFESARHARACT